jgi:hypothetical protein
MIENRIHLWTMRQGKVQPVGAVALASLPSPITVAVLLLPIPPKTSRPILKDSCTSARIARSKSSSLGRKRDVGHCASLRGSHES